MKLRPWELKMSDWEKGLPPIARERLARIGHLSPQEKEKIADSEKADSLLADFYQGRLPPEGLWQALKKEGKPSLFKEVQRRLLESLSLSTTPSDLKKRKEAILAVESLKEDGNTAAIETYLRMLEELPRRYEAEIQRAYKNVKAEVEKNPQLRLKQIQQGQNTVIIQLTVDEAIKQLPQWRSFLSEQEERYRQEFARITEKLIKELK